MSEVTDQFDGLEDFACAISRIVDDWYSSKLDDFYAMCAVRDALDVLIDGSK